MNTAEAEYRVGLNKEQDVLLDLGEDCRYVVLSPARAMELAGLLLKHAKKSPKCPVAQ